MQTKETTAMDSGELLRRYRDGDAAAAEAIYERYTERLLALARVRLSSKLARRVDAQDVLQSMYRSFFTRVREGQFSVEREGDLWRLLAKITLRKLARLASHHTAEKRSYRREDADLPGADGSLVEIAAREPSPADVVAAAEELHWLMSHIEPAQREVVERRLQGQTIEEIAASLGRNERTVRRWLDAVKETLKQHWSNDQVTERGSAASKWPVSANSLPMAGAAVDYRLEKLIGSGGMCKVYRATRKSTGDPVAIKVLRKRLRREPHLVERFLDEGRIVAEFSHPNIVAVHGLGRLPDGGYFMAMDFIEGEDLQKTCERGSLAWSRAAQIVATVARAIQYAHDRGVIHRDLKPGNVLIDRSGNVFVTDFGFAWLAGADKREDSIVGTAAFMAPEQIEPRRGAIGPYTDVYGLGALLYMLLTGRPPIIGSTESQVLERALSEKRDLPWPPGDHPLNDALRHICRKCLHLQPAERFQTAAEVAEALTSLEP